MPERWQSWEMRCGSLSWSRWETCCEALCNMTLTPPSIFISHKVFLNSVCRRQPPRKSVNLSFTITYIKNKLICAAIDFYKPTL